MARTKKPEILAYGLIFMVVLGLWYQGEARESELRRLSWLVDEPLRSTKVDWSVKSGEAQYQSSLISGDTSPHVHAATALTTKGGGIIAFWYGGSREGGKDVRLFQSKWSPLKKEWSSPKPIMSAKQLSKDLHRYIKKIGNPLAIRVSNGEIWLSFVSVSVGGWAGSQLNWMASHDEGVTWSKPARWVTSPFFNVSTLVKSPAQRFTNNWVGIPVYHEFIGKFAEYLMVDQAGNIQNKARMDWGRDNLQPLVIPTSASAGSAYLRFAGADPSLLLSTRTESAGIHWQRPEPIELPNPNAAVAGVALSGHEQLLVFNNSPKDRRVLSLGYLSHPEGKWRVIHDIEPLSLSASHGFSYPVLVKNQNEYHLFYSWNRKHIKHIVFNEVWLAKKIAESYSAEGGL